MVLGVSAELSVRGGAIYLSADVVDRYFNGIDAVIVLIQQGELMVMPVHQATSGGSLLKVRNLAGDRVVHARDVFQDQDLLDFVSDDLRALWQSEKGALCADLTK